MEKGKIKSIGEGDTGIIIDNDTDVEYPFVQPNLSNMAVGVNYLMEYDLVSDASGVVRAVNLDPIRKGTISSILPAATKTLTLYSGTVTDQFTKAVYSFESYLPEAAGAIGVRVKFDLLTDSKGGLVAVNLVPTVNQPK